MSRTKNSLKNFKVAMLGQGLGIIISFISRIFFVKILGSEFLGLNGLFTNILSVLSLAELGIGEAIIYSLYKPLAEGDIKQTKMLMQFYKKIYIVIGLIILILGISITPLLPIFIKGMPDIPNINLIYILFVINTAISYFYSYKRNLIIADQNRYIATIYRYGFYILLNIFQTIYIIFTKNYIGFLVLQIINTFLENLLISYRADKMYPYLKDTNKIPLNITTKNEIIKNTKAMMMHKIGGVVINSTDNIILSSIVSLASVGIYSNYALILTALNTILMQIYNSMTASVGNLCINSDEVKRYMVFKNINFLTFWTYSFSSICLLVLFNPFIEIWVGKEYLLNNNTVLVLIINFYLMGMLKSIRTFRDAMGLFEKDKYKPIFESIINIATSIPLASKFGTIGVFIGTFISSITTCFWVEPYILYKYGFKDKISLYFKDYFKYFIITIILGGITYILCSFIKGNIYIVFLIKMLVAIVIPNFLLFLLFYKSKEFKYFYDMVFSKK